MIKSEDERVFLYQCNCIDILGGFRDKDIDLIVTDLPYGVGIEYDGYKDTQENLKALVDAVMPEILRVSKVALITCGTGNMHLYPNPEWTLAWVILAGAGYGPWGFSCWQPILAYGKDPYLTYRLGGRPDIICAATWKAPNFDHPCPKPIAFIKQLIIRGAPFPVTVLDPFMGGGSHGVAAIQLGYKFIGIEQSESYFWEAKKNIWNALAQPHLFPPEKYVQASFKEEG